MPSADQLLDELRQTSIWTLVGWLGLGFTVIFTLFKLPYFLAPGLGLVLREAGQHLYILVWLLVLTTFNRTVRLRTLIVFWFIGIYPVFALAVLVGRPMAAIFGLSGHFVPDFWVPLTEEVVKALPVVLYLAWSAWSGRWQTSATDGLLLGLAVGSGFAMHEDIVDHRVGGSGVGSGTLLSKFFPTAWVNPSHTQFILGHAGWTALIGLGFGLAFLFRRRLTVWILPIATLLMVSFDHMTTNYIGNLGRDAMPWYVHGAYRLLMRDRLPAALLVIGIFGVVAVEQWILRWASERDRLFPPIPFYRLVSVITPPLDTRALLSARDYTRYRRGGHYAAWTWRSGLAPATDVADRMASVICSFALAAGATPGTSSDVGLSGGTIVAEPAPSEG